MASGDKNLKITCQIGTFDVKVENLSGKAEPRKINGKVLEMKEDGTPVIVRKNSKGEELTFCRVKDGKPMVNAQGEKETLANGYVDSKGTLCADVVPYYKTTDGDTILATTNIKTEVFEIVKFEPTQNFTDKYIVDRYYQIKPAQGKSKADFQRNAMLKANTAQMKKLYDYLIENQVVGRGILNITSSGYLPSIAYVRGVPIGTQGDWTIEIGVFKQQKRYTWVGSSEVEDIQIEQVEQAVPSIDEI